MCPAKANLEPLLNNLADTVDALLMKGFRSHFFVEKKSCGDLVTSIDREVDVAAAKILIESGFSLETIVSEERESNSESEEYWLIDPIDGTSEFANGVSEYAFSAALIKRGRVEAAVVSSPSQGFRAIATREKGFKFSTSEVPLCSWQGISQALIVSRSEFQAAHFKDFPTTRPIQPVGSIALKLAFVAAGLAALVISVRPKNSWDIAGGLGLVEIAGGWVRDLDGNAFTFTQPRERFRLGLIASLQSSVEMQALRAHARLRLASD